MDLILLDKLLLIVELFQRDMARAFAGTPLTPARVGVLWILQTRGPSTQQSIADALGVSARNVSVLVDALEANGYVRRSRHPTDRRAVSVELTRTATEMMTSMQRDHDELNAELLAAVPDGDLPGFERGIDAIVARLSALVADAGAEDDAGADAEDPTAAGARDVPD